MTLHEGVELSDDPVIAGVRGSDWYTDFCWCHSLTSVGFIFSGWPDGQPLNEQEIMTVQVFSLIKGELTYQIKKAAQTQ